MSYSLAVRNGDLVREGSSLAIVYGVEKLKQDLQCWVTERYGGDRFHPLMGSILQEYIGSVISPRTYAEIQDEVMRVLDNYQRVQYVGFKNNPRLYSLSEILDTIENVQVAINYDTVSVMVSVSTAAKTPAQITISQEV